VGPPLSALDAARQSASQIFDELQRAGTLGPVIMEARGRLLRSVVAVKGLSMHVRDAETGGKIMEFAAACRAIADPLRLRDGTVCRALARRIDADGERLADTVGPTLAEIGRAGGQPPDA